MATDTRTTFALRCLKCGHEDGVKLDLADLDTFSCNECGEDWTADEVRSLIGEWQRVLKWIDAVPAE